KMGFEIYSNSCGSLEVSNSISLIDKTDMISPIVSEPESPIKILAGSKLKIKKPNNAPANEKAKMTLSSPPAIKNQPTNAKQAIKPTPAANPSSPSIRLKALTITV